MAGSSYRPSSRHNALTWIDRNDNLWIYGGTPNYWSTFLADLWMFNTTSSQWKFIHESIPITEWGTKGTGVYNVTFPGENTGAVTWTNFASNELWFIAGSTDIWRSDVWKYSIDSGVWTWMAGTNEFNIARTAGIAQGVWYDDQNVTCMPAWDASSTIDTNGDIWFHGGNIPSYYLSHELWRFRPSTLQWMWVSGEGHSQTMSLMKDNVLPPSALGGAMTYVGSGVILYWPGFIYGFTNYIYADYVFSFNTSSMMWNFEFGTPDNETYVAPKYTSYHQADAGNSPGSRGEFSSLALGSLWIVRGFTPSDINLNHRDTFVFSVDICQNDLNPCDTNAKCTSYTGYADCECNAGYEGDGKTCVEPTPSSAPTASPESTSPGSAPTGSNVPSGTNVPSKTPAKVSRGTIVGGAFGVAISVLLSFFM